jgi:hypothetical protein
MKLKRMNLEVEYLSDLITHNGFLIEKEDKWAPINIDKLLNNPNYLDNEYRCDCGEFMGVEVLGQICPKCRTEISLHSLNFKYTGWLDISPHTLISPTYHNLLKKALSINMLKFILGDYKADDPIQYNENDTQYLAELKRKKRGRVSDNDIRTVSKNVPKSKMHLQGIGFNKFKEDFVEIMELCRNKQNSELVDTLIAERHAVFTSKVPIYSTAFRPESKTSESIYYPKINKWFARIISVAFKLPDMVLDMEIIKSLNHMQNDLIQACDHLINVELNRKRGLIRSQIVGGTFAFSARSVIVLGCDLRTDEVDIPYEMAIEGYKYKITYRLATRYNMTLEQAVLYINTHRNDPLVDSILDEIINEGQWVFLIREPTNNLASIGLMRIRGYKKNDTTITIPLTTLGGYNADFDGDELNLAFIAPELKDVFDAFHYSPLTDYIKNEHRIDFKEWQLVTQGLVSE